MLPPPHFEEKKPFANKVATYSKASLIFCTMSTILKQSNVENTLGKYNMTHFSVIKERFRDSELIHRSL